jgi:zinc transport system substrate-binding protein
MRRANVYLGVRLLAATVCAMAVALSACSHPNQDTPQTRTPPLKVVVTIAPLKGIVEPLLPPGSSVTVLMAPGKSEHGYEFTPADVASMARADLFVYVGLGLEGRIEAAAKKQASPQHRVLCFADAVGIKPAATDDDHDAPGHEESGHDLDHDHHHGPGYVDPHLWLDPALVERLIPSLKTEVSNAEHNAETQKGGADSDQPRLTSAASCLSDQVKAMDKAWTDRLAPLKGRSLVTHHNAFSRPAEHYGFKVAAVIREFETSEPSPGDLAKVVEAIRKENVKVIFVEPQFSSVAADRIAEKAGVKVGHLDPLGDGDWFKMMQANLDALVAGLSDSTDSTTGAK